MASHREVKNKEMQRDLHIKDLVEGQECIREKISMIITIREEINNHPEGEVKVNSTVHHSQRTNSKETEILITKIIIIMDLTVWIAIQDPKEVLNVLIQHQEAQIVLHQTTQWEAKRTLTAAISTRTSTTTAVLKE
jgi:hypothetical protein